jgi:hypothetical protein
MRRFVILFIAIGLMAGAVATAEAKKKPKPKPQPKPIRFERTVEGSYGSYPAPVTGCNSLLGTWACLVVPTRSTEAFFTAKVMDTHGQPVFVQVNGGGVAVARFCGETQEPVRFAPGMTLDFMVGLPTWGIQTDCPQHSVKSTGTINVTLSNLP